MNSVNLTNLKTKEVVDLENGKRLGHIIDIVINDCTGKIIGIIVPGEKGICFFHSDEIFIQWCNIKCIGEDVILVKHGGEKCKDYTNDCCKDFNNCCCQSQDPNC